jgi:uncharacterized protein (TIGR00645 family)
VRGSSQASQARFIAGASAMSASTTVTESSARLSVPPRQQGVDLAEDVGGLALGVGRRVVGHLAGQPDQARPRPRRPDRRASSAMRRIVMLPSGCGAGLTQPRAETDMRTILDKAILSSRWLLAVFFVGLAAALAIFAVRFVYKLWKFAAGVLDTEDTRHLIELLHLLDSALVASLVVMVAISSYDSLVSRLTQDEAERKRSWVAMIDPGNLKIKLATALIAISSIHLLQIFMEVGEYDDRTVTWAIAIHVMFLLGAVVLGLLDRMASGSKKESGTL